MKVNSNKKQCKRVREKGYVRQEITHIEKRQEVEDECTKEEGNTHERKKEADREESRELASDVINT